MRLRTPYRAAWSLRHFCRQLAEARRLGIRPHDLVLDVGSGQDPHPRANILCDRFPIDSTERESRTRAVIDRPLVVSDATQIPFPDKTFDFVFCSHLLEHMDDPAALLTELERVGRRGYIETPSKTYEKLWGWDFHRSYVSIESGKLILEAKPAPIFDDDLHQWFSTWIEHPRVWRTFIPKVSELGLLTTLTWEDVIPYEIRGDWISNHFNRVSSFAASSLDLEALAEVGLGNIQQIKSRVARWLRARSDELVDPTLASMHCPIDASTLHRSRKGWTCAGCGSSFPTVGHIHVMLPQGTEH